MNRRLLLTGFVFGALLSAQTGTAPVPSSQQSLYSELQGKLTAFDQTVSSQWDGTKAPVLFSGELLTANSNRGLQLLRPTVRQAYLLELNALKGLGIQAVVVKMGYPLLYQPFLEFNGDPQDYAPLVAFFQGVVTDAHALGLKVIVESAAVFPGYYTTGSGLNLTPYFSSITYDEYLNGEATINETIVTQIKPDYLNVGSEPDTEVTNTGFQQLGSPTGWAAAVSSYISKIPKGSGIPVGAGVGTWLVSTSSSYLQSLLTATSIDYIDLHIYPINDPPGSAIDIPTNTINLINQAEAAGKPVAVSEAWLLKVSDATYQQANAAGSPDTFARDAFSFWAPLDQQFLGTFYKVANWKRMTYFSAFWTRYFWSYIDYGQYGTESGADVTAAVQQVAGSALADGQISSTGQYVRTLLGGSAAATVVSAASFSTGSVAPGSIVTIFGSGLGTTTVSAQGALTTSLGGTSVNFTDSAGTTAAALLIYVSSGQVNAVVPSGLAAGAAIVAVTPLSGPSVEGSAALASVAPGLFSEGSSGSGVAAAETLTVSADGMQTYAPVFTGSGPFTTLPINLSGNGDQVFLILYGTGIQGRDSLGNVTAIVGGDELPVQFAGAQQEFPGLDQVNVLLPASLESSGAVTVQLRVDGFLSNPVQIQIQ